MWGFSSRFGTFCDTAPMLFLGYTPAIPGYLLGYDALYFGVIICGNGGVVTSKIPVTTTEVQDEMPTVAGVELAKHGQENCSY